MTRILVCGGRDYQDRQRTFEELDTIDDALGISLVIHGACMKKGTLELCGADRWAEEWAKARERPYIGFPAQWTKLGRPAGPHRNGEMIRRMRPEYGLAMPGGNGTANMVKQLKEHNIDCRQFER